MQRRRRVRLPAHQRDGSLPAGLILADLVEDAVDRGRTKIGDAVTCHLTSVNCRLSENRPLKRSANAGGFFWKVLTFGLRSLTRAVSWRSRLIRGALNL